MIRSFMAALLLTGAMSAQATQAPKVRIFFSDRHFENASMTFGLHHPVGGYSRTFGMTMPSGASFFEVAAVSRDGRTTDRFKALVWAPGCKMKEFDAPVEISDIELQFGCDLLKTVTFLGRVKSVDNLGSATISADYMGIGTCIWMDACPGTCVLHCGGPQIVGIATAEVAADGTFKVELPDFSGDPIVADDSSAEIEFRLKGVPNIPLLEPESSHNPWLKVAASYPAEVTFVPVEWEGIPRKSH